MARRNDYSARYRYSAEQVYAALSDRAYWDARTAEMSRHSTTRLDSFEVTDSGFDLVIEHVLARDTLPDIAKTVLKNDLVITRAESYGTFDGSATGRYTASIPAGPGSLHGTIELVDTDTGSTLTTRSEAKVSIPFVGGKLEQLILDNLLDLFRTEAQITASWLSTD
ncbi:hypothetical protein ABH922_003490 [Rhodococcus sp. 27YEA15]|uniref:DUF2505 domain-containing protein n=1 Tax=Rhodococcus sp. 27YEA15 TaxID=3156259 RepID=UPI003C79C4F6